MSNIVIHAEGLGKRYRRGLVASKETLQLFKTRSLYAAPRDRTGPGLLAPNHRFFTLPIKVLARTNSGNWRVRLYSSTIKHSTSRRSEELSTTEWLSSSIGKMERSSPHGENFANVKSAHSLATR